MRPSCCEPGRCHAQKESGTSQWETEGWEGSKSTFQTSWISSPSHPAASQGWGLLLDRLCSTLGEPRSAYVGGGARRAWGVRACFLALQAWMWVLLTNAGARGGRTSDRASADSGDIGCCRATLIVARIQSLEGSDPPSGRRQHTCPPLPPPSQGRLASSLGPGGHMSPRHR